MEIFSKKFYDYEENNESMIQFSEEELTALADLFRNYSTFQDVIKYLEKTLNETYYNSRISDTGYLYCLYNEVYQFYGLNVFKIGCAGNVEHRIKVYNTSFITKCEVKVQSAILQHYKYAEKLLFKLLAHYRIAKNREFFQCNIDIIETKIKEVEYIMNKLPLQSIVSTYEIEATSEKLLIHNFILHIIWNTNFNIILKNLGLELPEKDCSSLVIFPKNQKNQNQKNQDHMISLLATKDIDQATYDLYHSEKIKNYATSEKKLMMERFEYKTFWKVKEFDKAFLLQFYGKHHVLQNLRCLLDKINLNPQGTISNGTQSVVKFDVAKIIEQSVIIKDLINKLGFQGIGVITKIKKVNFEENIQKVFTSSILFDDQLKSIPVLNLDKAKLIANGVSTKKFIGYMNTILNDWGIRLKTYQSSTTIKKKQVTTYNYRLLYVNDIDKYL
ncbi:MAG: superfamily II helicase [Hyperionvirus sp.]|uniref:Superfamily II helicase n=1 Tax=Hyperionvirus sp. TaxID=2487770 RepID=A0A3G5A9F6_9VIRU|nr:MAG: superfamily II helicase [Hyperionvirus sp.]